MNRRIKIRSEQINLRIVENAIDEVSLEIGIKEDSYGKILVSTLEAVNNAILHGNNSNPEKFVHILLTYENKDLKIKVRDEGKGFKPSEVPDPTKPGNIEELSGRGVFLMSRLADKITFTAKGNCVTMVFKNVIT